MRRGMVAVLVVLFAACGDPETEDARGYTKAPLENPGLLVDAEVASPMDDLGVPDRPRPVLEVEQPGAGGDGDAATGGAAAGEAAGTGDAQEATLAAGVTQEQFEQGQQLFSGRGGCQACHGPNAGGSQLGPDLTDDEWLHIAGPEVDALAGVIRSGVSDPIEYPAPMPAMGGANLSADEVQALAGYLASLAQG